MPRWNRVRSRPIGVSAAGRVPSNVEEILGRKRQAGERPAGPPLEMDARTGNKGIDVVWHGRLGGEG